MLGTISDGGRRLDPPVHLTRGAIHRDIVARGSPLPEYGLPEGAEKGTHADRRLTSTRSASAMKPAFAQLDVHNPQGALRCGVSRCGRRHAMGCCQGVEELADLTPKRLRSSLSRTGQAGHQERRSPQRQDARTAPGHRRPHRPRADQVPGVPIFNCWYKCVYLLCIIC